MRSSRPRSLTAMRASVFFDTLYSVSASAARSACRTSAISPTLRPRYSVSNAASLLLNLSEISLTAATFSGLAIGAFSLFGNSRQTKSGRQTATAHERVRYGSLRTRFRSPAQAVGLRADPPAVWGCLGVGGYRITQPGGHH